jgi:uncharacterized protein involved in exopolysaccharide biosynthesis
MNEYENEIELMDYLNVLWKRKWFIIIPALLCFIAAAIISSLLPPKWEIDALIQPSKFSIETNGGQFEEVVAINPKQIAAQINQAIFDHLIADELNMDIKKLPKLKAENPKNTNLVLVSLKEKDVKKAKLILHSLFNHLKRELDEKVDMEKKWIDYQVKSEEIEKLSIEEEIKAYKNKLNIIKQRKHEIEREMSDIRNKIRIVDKELLPSLKEEKIRESESLAILVYSTASLQSLIYHNTLNELLSSKKNEEDNINFAIEDKEKKIGLLENEIDNLNEKKGRIDYTRLIKEPTSSTSPVSPKKKLNVLTAGILGLMIFTLLAFFLEYLKQHKAKRKG